MSSSGYQLWNVVAGEQPTASKWNILGNNDASFNSGVGFNDGVLVSRHFAANSVTYTTNLYPNVQSNSGGTQSITTSWQTVGNWGSQSLTVHGGNLFIDVNFSFWVSAVGNVAFRIFLNGPSGIFQPSNGGWTFYCNTTSSHYPMSRRFLITAIPAGTYVVAVQGLSQNGGNLNFDPADYLNLTTVEHMA